MTKRSPAMVIILTFITFGIYALIWYVKTKREIVSAGADIPTCLLMIVPFVNFYWLWKWCAGVEHVTRGESSAGLTFVMQLLVNQFFFIGSAITQSALNAAIDRGMPAQLPRARVA
jgi:hypothetical protein